MFKIVFRSLLVIALLMPAIIIYFFPQLTGTKFFFISMAIFCLILLRLKGILLAE
ncbi:hypothetical protein [Acinetobacter radioresistens]|uniref:hypothetical protein n=1 Tax=Acinetobacter radioresistens TaxID=40216 RepID=UPI0021CD638E|nr:hypothetical protein [Acinetobacter radioresistens]MCU4568123.1 hypothetical protein [Acinetobacter radioresistens]